MKARIITCVLLGSILSLVPLLFGGTADAADLRSPDPIVRSKSAAAAGDNVKSVKCKPADKLPCSYTCPNNTAGGAGCKVTLTVRTGGNPPIVRETFDVPEGHIETITGGGGLISSAMTH